MPYTVPPQHGRRIIVTGANSGTGREAARRLAAAGAQVVLAVRSLEKGRSAADAILQQTPDARLEVARLDLADLASVREFAAAVTADGRRVDVLVNNAGVMIPPQRYETADGFKLADMLLGRWLAALAVRLGWDLLSTVAHPGYTRTNLQTAGRNLGRSHDAQLAPRRWTILPSQGVETGAEPLLFAATSPEAAQGAYYGPRRLALVGPTHRASYPRAARSMEVAKRLWAEAERRTGTALPA
jgi:hypothetical protein